MIRTLGWDLKRAIEKYGFIPSKLPPNASHECGKLYWSGYWQKLYKVLTIDENDILNHVTVEWEDGTTTTHCTKLDTGRDWLLTPAIAI